ncbi:MAG: hypothetical protein DRO06_04075 [Thermoproteota archaeon]|nr:MAG: hypothetical protein DRO06_04075 [Candidatus Korarchaeota archaeon]
MRVLVTGASGFVGGHLVEELLSRGYDVVGMVRPTSDVGLLRELGVELRVADLTDPPSLARAVEGVDAVVHLAAYYTFHGRRELYRLVNVEGTRALLEACVRRGVRRFVYCSTTEAVGPVSVVPADEDHPPNPQYDYGRSKLEAEGVVRSYGGRVDYTILRPSGIYGPRCVDDVSYWFIRAWVRNSPTTWFIVGSERNYVQFAHVRDVVQGFALALEREESVGRTYFISEDRWYTYLEVYEIMAGLTGREVPTRRVPPALAKAMMWPVHLANLARGRYDFMWDPRTVDAVTADRAYSVERAKRELGYRPRYDLRTGLRETIEWYREEGIM